MIQLIPPRDFGPVSPEKMKTMAAILQDPNPIHWDVEVVKKLGMGDRPINQGPSNMSYLVNTLTSWRGDPGCLRELAIRYQANVFAGDVVHCEAEVIGIDGDLVRCAIRALVDGSPVITGSATLRWRQ